MIKYAGLYLFLTFIVLSCEQRNGDVTEIYQNKRNIIVDVHEKIKEIGFDNEIFMFNNTVPVIAKEYLLMNDYKSLDKYIHVFNKENFKYVASFATRGEGPGEIVRSGDVVYDKIKNKLYINDDGKQNILSYDLDSAILDPKYMPNIKFKMNKDLFPSEYTYLNDSICIGCCIIPIGNSDFKPTMSKFNIKSGMVEFFPYEHPKVKKKRILSDVSLEHQIYVEVHGYHDLMTICSLDGKLKHNIYGPEWIDEIIQTQFYGNVLFANDLIIAQYSGEKLFTEDHKVKFPTKLLVFDIRGNYIKTLETGYSISRMCFDEENNRLILSMDEEMQFGYLDLDGII